MARQSSIIQFFPFLQVVIAIVILNFVHILGERHKPRHDEIERVINVTHSVIWKCTNSECHPGSGLNVQCGISIPISTPIICVPCVKGANYSNSQDYSTCKSCKNCGKHENKRGQCTGEEDTTECLGTCHKGFYMDKITHDCHPCSDCCDHLDKHHEKQCEDSGLPSQQQCRQTNLCHPSTDATPTKTYHQPERPRSLKTLEIAAIVFSITMAVFIIGFLVLWWRFGWEQVKSTFKSCCCYCCNLVWSTGGNAVDFNPSDQDDLESAFCNVGGIQLVEDGDVLGTLTSGDDH